MEQAQASSTDGRIRNDTYAEVTRASVVAWIVYGIVEYGFCALFPWASASHFRFTIWHWGFTVLLFVVYAIVGVTVGAVTALFCSTSLGSGLVPSNIRGTDWATRLGSLSVVLALALNLIVRFRPEPVVISLLCIYCLLGLVLLVSLRSAVVAERFGFVAGPWTVSLSILSIAYIALTLLEDYSVPVRITATAASAVAVIFLRLAVAKNAARFRSAHRSVAVASSRRPILRLVSAVAGILIFSLLFVQTSPRLSAKTAVTSASNPQQVILIVMDTVRADHMSAYGYDRATTPELEVFSRGSTRYARAFASGDMTLATHGSMFTGLYPGEHGAHFDTKGLGQPLNEEARTVAQILSEHGYRTLGVASNHVFFGQGLGLERGFDYFDSREPPEFLTLHVLGQVSKFYLRQGIHRALTTAFPAQMFERHYRSAGEITTQASELLEQMKARHAPFLMFLNYMDAHWPYVPPEPFDRMFPGKAEEFGSQQFDSLLIDVMQSGKRSITETERRHLTSQYDGGLAYVDQQIGRLLARLKALDLYDSSLIIITSDHGEAFGEHGLVEHGVSVYQDQIGIPLMIKYPKSIEGRVVNRVVSSVDIAPTILEVLGLEKPKRLSGRSLMNDADHAAHCVIGESYPNVGLFGSRFQRVERAIVCGEYKFIGSMAGKTELYNLLEDPSERHNLFKAGDAVSERLQSSLDRFRNAVRPEEDRRLKLNKHDVERLRSLGYVK